MVAGRVALTNLATWPPKHQKWRPLSLVQSTCIISLERAFFLSLGSLSGLQNKKRTLSNAWITYVTILVRSRGSNTPRERPDIYDLNIAYCLFVLVVIVKISCLLLSSMGFLTYAKYQRD